MFALSEEGLIETNAVIEYSGKGSLWIAYQYIGKGLFDLVEADVRRAVTSRDFYGPLFENTRLVLARLVEAQESERVLSLYKAAISHRFRALNAKQAIVRKFAERSAAHDASTKWIKHYSPALKGIIDEYDVLLKSTEKCDPDLEKWRKELG